MRIKFFSYYTDYLIRIWWGAIETGSVRFVRGVSRGAGLLGKRGDLERSVGSCFEYVGRLFGRAGVELDQHVDHDLLLLVLVEANVGEELAHAGFAEGAVGEELGSFGARAAFDPVLIDAHRAGGDPRGAGDHPFPAVLDGNHPVVLEAEVRLVVHAVDALNQGLLDLVDSLGQHAVLGVDAADRVIVQLDLEVLGPAAVATQPCGAISVQVIHVRLLWRALRPDRRSRP